MGGWINKVRGMWMNRYMERLETDRQTQVTLGTTPGQYTAQMLSKYPNLRNNKCSISMVAFFTRNINSK